MTSRHRGKVSHNNYNNKKLSCCCDSLSYCVQSVV